MIVPPGLSAPDFSACSIMLSAIRSFVLPPGLADSTFARMAGAKLCTDRFNRIKGVLPMVSRMLSLADIDMSNLVVKFGLFPHREEGTQVVLPGCKTGRTEA